MAPSSDHAADLAYRDELGCHGKKPYRSRERATERARKMRDKYGVPFEAYHCRLCHAWHIGGMDPFERKRRHSWTPPSA